MSRTQKIVITVVVVAGLIIAGLIVVGLVDYGCCGTPIIIKGGSGPSERVEIQLPTTVQSPAAGNVRVDGGFDLIKVSSQEGCMIYDCQSIFCFANEILLNTSMEKTVEVRDTAGSETEINFEKDHFNAYDPSTGKFVGKDNLMFTTLEFSTAPYSASPKCSDATGKVECKDKWTNVTDLRVWINQAGLTCP
jgi:hypothetical protein